MSDCSSTGSKPSWESSFSAGEENEEEQDQEDVDYELTEEESVGLCRAFTLLDVDGDGVIDPSDLKNLLISWGRLPLGSEMEDILSYATATGCEGAVGVNFEGFKNYITKQLRDTTDEDVLREAFQEFDTTPPSGRVNVKELRRYLKTMEMKLTDDELDFLYKEGDYWQLDDTYLFEYEELISKILGKPTCSSKFLGC